MGGSMAKIPRLDEYIEQQTDKFEKKRRLLILSHLSYKPTGEKVEEGFRYFACDIGQLVQAFSRQDFGAIAKLPFALDESGDADTSAVLLDLAYTRSGSVVAAQPVEYQNYNPIAVANPIVFEGERAKGLAALVRELDQSA
ncbi:MAG: hypothetical protein A2289_04805 [Deltaproteobacteria bacterium RIFOXYA12_FULL_58_15]|nr:MAG: hypothetical protein A2289_04805 [Deltaproteobacteria bacterium RIFOXYA12_FULL_58_15]OGR14005.1 MAG: hypothetical protein A2341_18695 [Deltaproteobacteria bacterium RIFOXYB12_FULL_58_9]